MATEQKEVKKRFYSVVKEIGASDKCPPQAKLIIDTIKTAEGARMSREDLLTLLKRSPEEGGLKTNQTAERILGFYQPKLVSQGVLKVDEVSTMVEVEVADKPVPAEGAEVPAKPAKAKKSAKGAKGQPQSEDAQAA